MKLITTATLMLFVLTSISAQQTKEKNLLIVPCESGSLYIDGVFISQVDANDPSKQLLSYGEHYLQLKNNIGKTNLVLRVDDTTRTIIKLGCDQTFGTTGIKVLDKTILLRGFLSDDTEQNIFAFDSKDEIHINATVTDKKGTATLFITDNAGREIYRKQDFRILENDKVLIPSKGIYKIVMYTDALFGKNARLKIDRIPSSGSDENFSTTPKIIYDTSYLEILQTTTRVFSTTNLNHPNKTTISINLPANTSYWTYWIGVDQEAQNGMKNFIKDLSPALKAISPNPLVLFGLKMIPSLPMLNAPATVNYKFMNSVNAQRYVRGEACQYYTFKHANNICTDYSWVSQHVSDLVLSMENESTMIGHNVEIRVVAFMVKSRLSAE